VFAVKGCNIWLDSTLFSICCSSSSELLKYKIV